MSGRELAEWREYEVLEPFGQLRDNFHSAQIAWVLANQNRAKHSAPIPMSQFFYVDDETASDRRDAAMIEFLESKVQHG